MKAVLVLDEMPESCEECPSCRRDTFGQLGCSAQSHVISAILRMVGQKKPGFCPLCPMPEKVDEMLEDGSFMDGFYTGWNDAIRAIEGSGEDE